MSDELRVINLNEKSVECHPLDYSFLPNPAKCFRLLVFAPSNSGKSNVVKNIITRKEFGLCSYYNKNIFLFSQTIHLDPIWKDVGLPKTHLNDHWNDELVRNVMNYSKQQPRGVLMVLDDMITCDAAVNNKKANLLKTLFFQGRHFKVSLILISQKMKEIPIGMRVNATHLVCFNLKNRREEQDFFDENEYVEDVHKKYERATSERFNFLYINKETGDAYHNFETKLS